MNDNYDDQTNQRVSQPNNGITSDEFDTASVPLTTDANVRHVDDIESQPLPYGGLVNQDDTVELQNTLEEIEKDHGTTEVYKIEEQELSQKQYLDLPVPGIDNDYYEQSAVDDDNLKHVEQYDTQAGAFMTPEQMTNLSPEDKEALLASGQIGIGTIIRENAHLVQDAINNRKTLSKAIFVSLALLVACVGLLIAFLSYPKVRYIPTKDNTSICEVTAENNPNLTDPMISNFAKDAVVNLYTMDYINWKSQSNASLERWFTNQGRVDTIKAIQTAGITDYLEKNALTMRATNTGAPQIEQTGSLSDGTKFWLVRFPMIIDVFSGKPTPEDTQRYIVSVRVIADTASAQNPAGLGVNSVTLKPN